MLDDLVNCAAKEAMESGPDRDYRAAAKRDTEVAKQKVLKAYNKAYEHYIRSLRGK